MAVLLPASTWPRHTRCNGGGGADEAAVAAASHASGTYSDHGRPAGAAAGAGAADGGVIDMRPSAAAACATTGAAAAGGGAAAPRPAPRPPRPAPGTRPACAARTASSGEGVVKLKAPACAEPLEADGGGIGLGRAARGARAQRHVAGAASVREKARARGEEKRAALGHARLLRASATPRRQSFAERARSRLRAACAAPWCPGAAAGSGRPAPCRSRRLLGRRRLVVVVIPVVLAVVVRGIVVVVSREARRHGLPRQVQRSGPSAKTRCSAQITAQLRPGTRVDAPAAPERVWRAEQ